jgi:hypothetical protein
VDESGQGSGRDGGRDDRDRDRDRYRELLEEFRVILPGVQALFGFLLVAPLSSRFARTQARTACARCALHGEPVGERR